MPSPLRGIISLIDCWPKVASFVIQELPPLTLEGRGESAKIVDWVRTNFPVEQIGSAQYYTLLP